MTVQKYQTNDGVDHEIPYGERTPTHHDILAMTKLLELAGSDIHVMEHVRRVCRTYAMQFRDGAAAD